MSPGFSIGRIKCFGITKNYMNLHKIFPVKPEIYNENVDLIKEIGELKLRDAKNDNYTTLSRNGQI